MCSIPFKLICLHLEEKEDIVNFSSEEGENKEGLFQFLSCILGHFNGDPDQKDITRWPVLYQRQRWQQLKSLPSKMSLRTWGKIVDQMSEKSAKCLMVESFNQIQLLQEMIDATSQKVGLFCEQTNDAQAPALWEKVCMEKKESKSKATWKLSGLIKDETILDKTTFSGKPKKDTGKRYLK